MENNRIIDKKFTRRGFLGGAVISGNAFSLSSTLGATLPAYASTTHSTEESEESLPSGLQFEIQRGNMRAVITEVGATLRVFEVGGQEFLFTFSQNEMSMFSEGQVLIPFPKPHRSRHVRVQRRDGATSAERTRQAECYPRAYPLDELESGQARGPSRDSVSRTACPGRLSVRAISTRN